MPPVSFGGVVPELLPESFAGSVLNVRVLDGKEPGSLRVDSRKDFISKLGEVIANFECIIMRSGPEWDDQLPSFFERHELNVI